MAPPEFEPESRTRTRTENKEKENNYQENPTKMISKGKPVCVMDASGSLGSELVNALLLRGYIVHAALQSHIQGERLNIKLHCSKEHNKNLKIFYADLLDYHSILETLSGCAALFYTFEPPSEHPIYDEHMAEIEVRAAHNVLEACAQTPTMEKVIYTSSATAVIWADISKGLSTSSDYEVDEKSWSDISFCKKYKLWHALSKTLAEKTAWALAMDRGVNMVTVNGGLLLPNNNLINNSTSLPATTKTKHNTLPPYLKGAAEMYEQGLLVAVDLKFLVDAHICVFEQFSSYGRYLCFNHVINSHKDAVKIATMFISSPPESSEDTRVYPQRISNKKLNKLMLNFGQFQLH